MHVATYLNPKIHFNHTNNTLKCTLVNDFNSIPGTFGLRNNGLNSLSESKPHMEIIYDLMTIKGNEFVAGCLLRCVIGVNERPQDWDIVLCGSWVCLWSVLGKSWTWSGLLVCSLKYLPFVLLFLYFYL